ncbi:hypothetical protein [Streptomyces sp. NPDC059743]|uniref:hypothetical protein n=1 Tax=Streptomyces sp. NPDC059743 TaxID=3346928 RepID=UPI0036519BC4
MSFRTLAALLARTLRRSAAADAPGHQDAAGQHHAARARGLNRALISHLARRDEAVLLPVLVRADGNLPPTHPLTVLLLARLCQVTAERDAYRAWVTADPVPPTDQQLRAAAAEAAGFVARRDSP